LTGPQQDVAVHEPGQEAAATPSPAPGSRSRSRTHTWQDPMLTADAARSMAGIDFLRAVASGDLPPPPMATLMDLRIAELAEGRVVFEVEPGEYHYNPIGMVHGGLAATLCDSAMGCAVHSVLPAGVGYTTLEVKVNFLRPMTVATGVVRCEATVVSVGSRVATAEARVVDAAGKLYSHATTTCLLLRPDAVRP
jgi:uncharacterized protein (TIGR00369 family)